MTFNPPGRPDLKLEHWTKVLKDAVTGRLKVDEEEYPFKKFNKKVWLSFILDAVLHCVGMGRSEGHLLWSLLGMTMRSLGHSSDAIILKVVVCQGGAISTRRWTAITSSCLPVQLKSPGEVHSWQTCFDSCTVQGTHQQNDGRNFCFRP